MLNSRVFCHFATILPLANVLILSILTLKWQKWQQISKKYGIPLFFLTFASEKK